MPVILQINFSHDLSEQEFARKVDPQRAKIFWTVPGLRWKIWLRDSERRESGGIYLFEDRACAQAYADGPIAAGVRNLPASSDHSFKIFDITEATSTITGAPLDAEMMRGAR